MSAFQLSGFPFSFLIALVILLIILLVKGADMLVEQAVNLSIRWGLPKLLIGVTIVSLGTTFPEAAVSVTAAIEGRSDIALGNAVGSIICDTGLILGLAALLSPLPLQREMINRQGWIQFAAALLVVSCFPFLSADRTFVDGGRLPQFMGVFFLMLLAAYIWTSVYKMKTVTPIDDQLNAVEDLQLSTSPNAGFLWIKLVLGIIMVAGASFYLVPVVQETAMRLHVPDSIISATLVAFGTSLPELVTALTAVRKGCGELAIGNVIGANILNVLFVTGAAASVTSIGLSAPPDFFRISFPAMLFLILLFHLGVQLSGNQMKRPFGAVLLSVYLFVTFFSYSHAHV